MDHAALDGNAIAGDLADVFTFDVTTATTICAACHGRQGIATLHAYVRAPGHVLRCATCDAVQIRFTRAPGRVWLDLRGVTALEIPQEVVGSTAPIEEATR